MAVPDLPQRNVWGLSKPVQTYLSENTGFDISRPARLSLGSASPFPGLSSHLCSVESGASSRMNGQVENGPEGLASQEIARSSPLSPVLPFPCPAELTPASSQRRTSDPSPASPIAVAQLQACKQPQEQRPGGLQKGRQTGTSHRPTPTPLGCCQGRHQQENISAPQATQRGQAGPLCRCAPGSGVSALSCMPGDKPQLLPGKPRLLVAPALRPITWRERVG